MKYLNKRTDDLIRETIIQLRTFLIFLLICLYAAPYLVQGYLLKNTYHVSLNLFGNFACTINNVKILLMCFVGYIILLSDLPFFDTKHMYEVIRSRKSELMAVRVIYIIKMTILYLIVLFLIFSLISGSSDFNLFKWDKFRFSSARGIEIDNITLESSKEIVLNYAPISAFMTSITLLFLVFSSFGFMLLFFSMLLPVKKGVISFICVWSGMDMAIDEMGLGYRLYIASPLSYTRLEILGANAGNLYFPSKVRILLMLILLFFGFMFLCIFFPIKRRLNRLDVK